MSRTITFGGRSKTPSRPRTRGDTLAGLLGELSWKYVKERAEFESVGSLDTLDQEELSEKIAHWAGRVWFHANEMPTGSALRNFDLLAMESSFRRYIASEGEELFDIGLTVEEIWASQQLYSATPIATVIARGFADLVTERMELTRIQNSQDIVWTLGAMCFEMHDLLDGKGFNVLVSDGTIGHTIYIKGLNGIDFEHPRGVRVRAGWFSFHDPWPARSLLAPERNFGPVRVLEDVSRPPLWLISPDDLDKVVVGYLLPVNVMPAFLEIFGTLDLVRSAHAGRSLPLWLDSNSPDPEQPFASLFGLFHGVAPTTAEGLFGLGKTRLLMGNLQDALECFEGAVNLGLPGAARMAANVLESAGYLSVAKNWAKRMSQGI